MLVAIEVKSGRLLDGVPGLRAIAESFRPRGTLLVGGDAVPLGEFYARPVTDWLGL